MIDTHGMSGTAQSDSVRRRRARATDIGTLPVDCGRVGENDAKVLAKCGDLKWDADRRVYLHA